MPEHKRCFARGSCQHREAWAVRVPPGPTLGSVCLRPPACEACPVLYHPLDLPGSGEGGVHLSLFVRPLGVGEARTSTPSEGPAGGSSGLWPNFPASRGRNIWGTRKKPAHYLCPVSPAAPGPAGHRAGVLSALAQECRGGTLALPGRPLSALGLGHDQG